MTFGYNASITSQFASNFNRIKGIAAALNDALANMRTTNEVPLCVYQVVLICC